MNSGSSQKIICHSLDSLLTLIVFLAFQILTSNGDQQEVSQSSFLPLARTILVIIVSKAFQGSLGSARSPLKSRLRVNSRSFWQATCSFASGRISDPPGLEDVVTSFSSVFGDIWLSIRLAYVAEHGLASWSVDVGSHIEYLFNEDWTLYWQSLILQI